jgi:hypothetical protein
MKRNVFLMSAFMALVVLFTASCQRVEEKEVVYKEKKATVAVYWWQKGSMMVKPICPWDIFTIRVLMW